MHGFIPPFPQKVSMAWHLVKHKDNFARFYFIFAFRYETSVRLSVCLSVFCMQVDTCWRKRPASAFEQTSFEFIKFVELVK